MLFLNELYFSVKEGLSLVVLFIVFIDESVLIISFEIGILRVNVLVIVLLFVWSDKLWFFLLRFNKFKYNFFVCFLFLVVYNGKIGVSFLIENGIFFVIFVFLVIKICVLEGIVIFVILVIFIVFWLIIFGLSFFGIGEIIFFILVFFFEFKK